MRRRGRGASPTQAPRRSANVSARQLRANQLRTGLVITSVPSSLTTHHRLLTSSLPLAAPPYHRLAQGRFWCAALPLSRPCALCAHLRRTSTLLVRAGSLENAAKDTSLPYLLTDVYTHAKEPFSWSCTRTDVESPRQTHWWRFMRKLMALRPMSERMRRRLRHHVGTKKQQIGKYGAEVVPTREKYVEMTRDTAGYELEFWVSEGADGSLGYTLSPTCAPPTKPAKMPPPPSYMCAPSWFTRARSHRLIAQLVAENYQLIDQNERLQYISIAVLPDPNTARALRTKVQSPSAGITPNPSLGTPLLLTLTLTLSQVQPLADADPDALAARQWVADCVTTAGLPSLNWQTEVHLVKVVPQKLRLAVGDGAAAGKRGSRVFVVRVQYVSWGDVGAASVACAVRAGKLADAVSSCPARVGTGSPLALTEPWHGGVPAFNDNMMVSCDAREQYQKKITLIDYGGATACEAAPHTFKHGAHLMYTSMTVSEVNGGDKAHVQRPHFLNQLLLMPKAEQPTLVTPAQPTLRFVAGVCLLVLAGGTRARCSDCAGEKQLCPLNFLPATQLGVGCGCNMQPRWSYPIQISGMGDGAVAHFITDPHGVGFGIVPSTFKGGSGYCKGTTATLPTDLALPPGCTCQLKPQVSAAPACQLTGFIFAGTDQSIVPISITISSLSGGNTVVLSNALPAGEWPVQLQEYASLEETTTMTGQFVDLTDAPWFVLTGTTRRVGLPGAPNITSSGDSMWKQEECGGRPGPCDKFAPLPLWKCTEEMMRSPEGQRECEPFTTDMMDVFGSYADVSFLRTAKSGKVSCANRILYAARMQPLVDAIQVVLVAVDSVCMQLDPSLQVAAAKSNSARAAALRVAAATAATAAGALTPAMEAAVVGAVGSLRTAVIGVRLATGQGLELKRTIEEICDALVRQVTKVGPPDGDDDDGNGAAAAAPQYKAKAAITQNLQSHSSQLAENQRKLETSGTTKKGDMSLHPRGALHTVLECTSLAEKTVVKITEIQRRGGIVPGAARRPVFGAKGTLASAATGGEEELVLRVQPDGGAGIADEASGFFTLEGVVLLLGGDDTACVANAPGACALAVTLTGEVATSTILAAVSPAGNPLIIRLQSTKVLTLKLTAALPDDSDFDAGTVVKEGTREWQAPHSLAASAAFVSKPTSAEPVSRLVFPIATMPLELHGGGWLTCGGSIVGVQRVFAKNSVRDTASIADSAAPGGLVVWQRANDGLVNPASLPDGLFAVLVGRKVSGQDAWAVHLDPSHSDAVAVSQGVERFALTVSAQPSSDGAAVCWYDVASITCTWNYGLVLVQSTVGFREGGTATMECAATPQSEKLSVALVIDKLVASDACATYAGARVAQQFSEGHAEELGCVWSERLTGAAARFKRTVGGSNANFKTAMGVLFDDGCYKSYSFSRAAGSSPSSFTHLHLDTTAAAGGKCPAGAHVPGSMVETFGSVSFRAAVAWPADRATTAGCTLSQTQSQSNLASLLSTFTRPPAAGAGALDPALHLNVLGTTVDLTPTTALSPSERTRVNAGECRVEYNGPPRYTAVPQVVRFAREGRELLAMPLSEAELVLPQRLASLAAVLKTSPADDEGLRAEHGYMSHGVLIDYVEHLDDAMHSPFNCMRTGSCNKAVIFATARDSKAKGDAVCQMLCQQGVSCGKKQHSGAGAASQCKQFRGGVIEIFISVSVEPISNMLHDDGELWALSAHANKEFIDLLYMGPAVAETKYFCTDDGTNRAALYDHAAWLLDTWIEVQQKLNPGQTVNDVRCTDTVYTRSCVQMVMLVREQFLKGRPPKGVDVAELKNAQHRESVRRPALNPHTLRHLTSCDAPPPTASALAEDRAARLRHGARRARAPFRRSGHDDRGVAWVAGGPRPPESRPLPGLQAEQVFHSNPKVGVRPCAPRVLQGCAWAGRHEPVPDNLQGGGGRDVRERVAPRAKEGRQARRPPAGHTECSASARLLGLRCPIWPCTLHVCHVCAPPGHYTCEKVQIFDADNGCATSYRAFTDSTWIAPVQGDSCALDGDDDDDEEADDDDGDGDGEREGGGADEEEEAEREEAEREEAGRDEAAGEGQ